MLASVRAEMLELRRDVAAVLANLVVVLKIPPEERQKYVERKRSGEPSHVTAAEVSQVEALRGEILEFRRDLAFTMAQLLVANVGSQEQAKEIVLPALKPKAPKDLG